jgi:glycosyltransferase involved in cell wall biosynthesis
MTLIEHGPPDAGLREHQSVSVVIPACSSARDLIRVLEQLPAFIDEVVLVDGSSADGVIAAARAIRPDVRVVFDVAPDGGPALRTGFAGARGDCVVALSADEHIDAADIARFVAALQLGGTTWPQAA